MCYQKSPVKTFALFQKHGENENSHLTKMDYLDIRRNKPALCWKLYIIYKSKYRGANKFLYSCNSNFQLSGIVCLFPQFAIHSQNCKR